MTSSRAYNIYKLIASSNSRTTRTTCSAYGCGMKSGTNKFSEIKMFTFPRNPYRRRRWELATRRANWKSHSRSRICSKHFITGRPSKDPNHPDYVPSIFTFNKNSRNSRSLNRKTRRKVTVGRSCGNSDCVDNYSHKETDSTSFGIKGFCNKCFSSESASSAFGQSLEPLNYTLTQMMLKLTDLEEERKQLHHELALCRGEIHQLREAHRKLMKSTKTDSIRNSPSGLSSTSSEDIQSLYADDQADDLSEYLEQIYNQPDEARKNKRKERERNSSLVSKSISKSPKDRKSSDTSSPITIIYLKP